jgi:putative oxidoreductase
VRHFGLLIARVVFGCYLAVHGAQKLFGSFNGSGPDKTGGFFEQIGIRPGKPMAYLAGASELTGGVLTATGIADPLGPIILAGTPLTNMAMAIALMSSGTGALRLGPRAPRALLRFSLVAGIVLAGVAVFQILSPKGKPEMPANNAEDENDEAPN